MSKSKSSALSISFVLTVTSALFVKIKKKMSANRILRTKWPLNVEKNYQNKKLSLSAVREQPKVSSKFQTEVHKYVLRLENDGQILDIDEDLISLMNELLTKILHSIKKNYDEKTQKEIFAQVNFTCQGNIILVLLCSQSSFSSTD